MFLILGSKEINKTLSFPSTILQSSVMSLVKCTAFYYDAKNTMTFHSIYEVLCFKTMAKRDILILLFKKPTGEKKKPTYFTAKSYTAACQSKGPHPKRPVVIPQKENEIALQMELPMT